MATGFVIFTIAIDTSFFIGPYIYSRLAEFYNDMSVSLNLLTVWKQTSNILKVIFIASPAFGILSILFLIGTQFTLKLQANHSTTK